MQNAQGPLNAFCVDLEEWFHVCDARTGYEDTATWGKAAVHVVEDTQTLLRLLDETGVKATFLAVGWVADAHPGLIRRLSDAGHEIGCHGYWHRLLYTQTPDEFREDLARSLDRLRSISGQAVQVYRAPGFSMKPECFWAYPILRRSGITTDVSIVPAPRDHGGIDTFPRDPLLLHTDSGRIRLFPVSVMSIAGRRTPFSGGGYLRLFPQALIHYGVAQNLREGRPCMCYIHPREINVNLPRLRLPFLKYFKCYVGLRSTRNKLRAILRRWRFGTVTEVMENMTSLPEHELSGGRIRPCSPPRHASAQHAAPSPAAPAK